MLGSEVLDVGVGMALLFLFMSLIATALREVIEAMVKSRAKDLEKGIKALLSDPAAPPGAAAQPGGAAGQPGAAAPVSITVERLYQHPLVFPLFAGAYKSGTRSLPSYIPRENFARALLDLVADASRRGSALSMEGLRTALVNKPDPTPVERMILTAMTDAGDDIAKVQAAVERWYDGSMDRVAGWYKRRTSWVLAGIGLGAAIAFNVDAITVAQRLVEDKALRETVVAQASQVLADPGIVQAAGRAAGQVAPGQGGEIGSASAGGPVAEARAAMAEVSGVRNRLDQIGFPIGWAWTDAGVYPRPQACVARADGLDCSAYGWRLPAMALGWLITALAIMLGAPFWFDVLNKVMVVRATVKPREKSPDEASEDRQAGGTAARPGGAAAPMPGAVAADATDAAQLIAAASFANLAAQQGHFVPHEWAVGNPQGGMM